MSKSRTIRFSLLLILLLILISVGVLGLSSCSTNSAGGGKIATAGTISVEGVCPYPYCIRVELKPTSSARANWQYTVDLYEKGSFRAHTYVSFNQPEINVGGSENVYFPASEDELNAYFNSTPSQLWKIFSVKVY